jgi:hypothetical protein
MQEETEVKLKDILLIRERVTWVHTD